MEKILKQNDHKSGWQTAPYNYLYRRLLEETTELFIALYEYKIYSGRSKKEAIINECVDIANFAMMIADKSLNNKDTGEI